MIVKYNALTILFVVLALFILPFSNIAQESDTIEHTIRIQESKIRKAVDLRRNGYRRICKSTINKNYFTLFKDSQLDKSLCAPKGKRQSLRKYYLVENFPRPDKRLTKIKFHSLISKVEVQNSLLKFNSDNSGVVILANGDRGCFPHIYSSSQEEENKKDNDEKTTKFAIVDTITISNQRFYLIPIPYAHHSKQDSFKHSHKYVHDLEPAFYVTQCIAKVNTINRFITRNDFYIGIIDDHFELSANEIQEFGLGQFIGKARLFKKITLKVDKDNVCSL